MEWFAGDRTGVYEACCLQVGGKGGKQRRGMFCSEFKLKTDERYVTNIGGGGKVQGFERQQKGKEGGDSSKGEG